MDDITITSSIPEVIFADDITTMSSVPLRVNMYYLDIYLPMGPAKCIGMGITSQKMLIKKKKKKKKKREDRVVQLVTYT